MKFILFLCIGLCCSLSTQAQIQHQIGFETGINLNKGIYTLSSDPNIRFIQEPDLSSEFTLGLMGALKYDLLLIKHLHLGMGLGVEIRTSPKQDIETTNLLLPIEIGYRSASIGKMYLTGDLLFLPHVVVSHLQTYYDSNQEVLLVAVPHRPLNIQVGAKAGIGWKLSDRIDLQVNLLGKIDLFRNTPEDAVIHQRYWGLHANIGLRWTL